MKLMEHRLAGFTDLSDGRMDELTLALAHSIGRLPMNTVRRSRST